MIVGERKPLDEIRGMLKGYKKVLVLGCRTCVAVCMAGGDKEVELLGSLLRIAAMKDSEQLEIVEDSVERQCDREYIEPIREKVTTCDAVLSMACGCGVQFMAELCTDKPVLPAINTNFIGVTESVGVWTERCAQCGNCVLHMTGGICPIARCSKSLLNGPCGGSQNGKCEISPDVDCGWALIYNRMAQLGQLEKLAEVIPAKDWTTSRDGGPRKIVREDVKI
ncbi:MAG: methylenetetrahydrofolate reductase C-terminal domain-containing protein [Candidatus Lindowbacteria bacterium]|nr:methylenetetrahydrofolate reductase C-terminal domain-containing protein [Candidatus Lindowbacteria bacterium]